MSKQDFQQPLDPPRYRWLPHLIILMNLVAVAAGVFLLRSVEHRLVYSAGEELRIAAAEVADKLDRLLFERYGDAHMMAQALALRPSDTAYLTSYVGWMKTNHAPVYAWLGVTDSRGMMIAATESSCAARISAGQAGSNASAKPRPFRWTTSRCMKAKGNGKRRLLRADA